MPAERHSLFEHVPGTDDGQATVVIDLTRRAERPISPLLYGKFCEHLGSNIYNGMDAQILLNPTFGQWAFGAGDDTVNGGSRLETDPVRIRTAIEGRARRLELPDASALVEAYESGGACFWQRVGPADAVRLSPDVAPSGSRAQRVEVLSGRGGIGQWTYLPAHRTREYSFRVFARAATPTTLRAAISVAGGEPGRGPELDGEDLAITAEWAAITGRLSIAPSAPADALYFVSLTAPEGANVVLSRALLWPADYVDGADPDVIARLREAHLPLLRWPGGNFVSGYHWRDGVGPADLRPTHPNPAWGGLECNLFGTDEFVQFCRAVGCEPMICVNAGNGSAEEAAAWVEYCNGPPESAMGRLRAANGHPEPYRIRFWEVGNEIYGRWQVGWTTPGGCVDRYRRFAAAMRAADPTIYLIACGQGYGHEWNDRLFAEAADEMSCVTRHVLRGGRVDAETDPAELYEAFMGLSPTQGERWRAMRRQMEEAGIDDPRLAITELQLFARGDMPHMPRPDTIAEPLYDALLINECIRLGDFVKMLTHSATVNHGGGLRKARERVWPTPAHWGHVLGAEMAGLRPVPVRVQCGTYSTPGKAGDLPAVQDRPLIDAMAAVTEDGNTLRVMLISRTAKVPAIAVLLDAGAAWGDGQADVRTLAGSAVDDRNTPDEPDRIRPRECRAAIRAGKATVELPRFSMACVSFQR
jgi:alpha-N-arabinofuranosidase